MLPLTSAAKMAVSFVFCEGFMPFHGLYGCPRDFLQRNSNHLAIIPKVLECGTPVPLSNVHTLSKAPEDWRTPRRKRKGKSS